jgi:hypothetical protein
MWWLVIVGVLGPMAVCTAGVARDFTLGRQPVTRAAGGGGAGAPQARPTATPPPAVPAGLTRDQLQQAVAGYRICPSGGSTLGDAVAARLAKAGMKLQRSEYLGFSGDTARVAFHYLDRGEDRMIVFDYSLSRRTVTGEDFVGGESLAMLRAGCG